MIYDQYDHGIDASTAVGIICTSRANRADRMCALLIGGRFVNKSTGGDWAVIRDAIVAGAESGEIVSGKRVWDWHTVPIVRIEQREYHCPIRGYSADYTIFGTPSFMD